MMKASKLVLTDLDKNPEVVSSLMWAGTEFHSSAALIEKAD